MGCSGSLLEIMLLGLTKDADQTYDPKLEDQDSGEWTVSLAAACALEHMARVMKNAIIEPVLKFI